MNSQKAEPEQQQQQQTFPFKLFKMIEYANTSGFSRTLSWSPDGNTFVIHDKDVMMNDLAPLFFKQTQFRSFTRQLNIWDFERTGSKGWQHKDFIRGRPDLLEHIVRTENKSKSAGAVKRNMMWTSCSVSRGNVSSRSAVSRNAPEAKRKRAKTEKVVIDVADESSSFSTSRARADYLFDDRAHLHNLQKHVGTVAAAGTTTTTTSTSTTTQVTSTKQEPVAEAEVMLRNVGTSTCSTVGEVAFAFEARAQPIDDDESMIFYLADMFGKHESERPSHEDVLWSILSLNRETTFEDLFDL